MAANKVGCDAHVDPRLGSPLMQAPSFTGDGAGRVSELGTTIEGSGAGSNGTPAVGNTTQPDKQSDTNRFAAFLYSVACRPRSGVRVLYHLAIACLFVLHALLFQVYLPSNSFYAIAVVFDDV